MKTVNSTKELSDAALLILNKRILRRDESNNPLETPDKMFRRVAEEVARVERKYGASEQEVYELAESFFDMMRSFDFLPNSPTLVNAGVPDGQLSGCFVLPVEDSMESIFRTLGDMALIQKTGGGTGFSFSRLRPRDDLVSSTRGSSSGPVSFMKLYDFACETTRLGGARSGANMAVMRFDHPDIIEFINAKKNSDSLRTFNISVAVTEFFMDCVHRSTDYPLINPRTKGVVGHLNAREVFNAIVRLAWQTGDPGLIFLDAVNKQNPTPLVAEIEATNPCGEQPLLPYESCNLGSINVSHFVHDSKIDFHNLTRVVHLAIRFLDNVIDANHYPLPLIEAKTKANRKIGLGIMGFADLLLLLGLPYDSEQALAIGKELMEFVSANALAESCRLGETRGVFPNHGVSIYESQKVKRRNAAVTTIAPTGTISLIANCSSGIEPLFAICYVRQMLGRRHEFAVHPLFERIAAEFLDDDTRDSILKTGSVQNLVKIPESMRRIFVTAHDIDPVWHVRMQAAFQCHVDSAVSKTVNLRHEATSEEIARIYLLAHELGCKGITVFRDGCKEDQVLNLGGFGRPEPVGGQVCPECGGSMKHDSACVTCLSCGYTFCTI